MEKKNKRGGGKLKPVFVRKVLQNKDSHYIYLPKPFCRLNNIAAGDTVCLTSLDFGRLLELRPLGKANESV